MPGGDLAIASPANRGGRHGGGEAAISNGGRCAPSDLAETNGENAGEVPVARAREAEGALVGRIERMRLRPCGGRDYAVQGVMMLQSDAFEPAIPTQYPAAKAANPNIKTVVMTGGGNDIIQNATLQTDCMNGGAMCKMTLDPIGDAFSTLWTQMAADGVQDVVRVNYSNDVGSVAQSLRGDGGAPEPSICSTGKIRCWEYDSTAAVMKQIAADGIHPLSAANQRMATEIFALMTNEGMRR